MNTHFRLTSDYFTTDECRLEDLASLAERRLTKADVPLAADIQKNIPIYDVPALADDLADPAARQALMGEWARVLHSSAGVFALSKAQEDQAAIDDATAIFNRIIKEEKAAGGDGADHFAAAGSNDRIWNSLQKLCFASPETYVRYYACPAVDAAAEAWLGPNYQMTVQVNLVYPGGKAQQPHRDYHLGFQTAEVCAHYPAHVHDLSPLLTLQGGIAHCDVPVDGGPTKLLPFSQLYRPGYVAWRRDDFRQYFEDHFVQLPLKKGDAMFFNPALLHAAGDNRTPDLHRLMNLMQISSPFGRAMESVDRVRMCKTVYGALQNAWADGRLSQAQLHAVVASTAEGYSFPSNLDNDPPTGALAAETQAAHLKHAITSNMPVDEFARLLDQREAVKRP
ncbi:MAG: phytanoyl-CoA dioxygenase family protein [Pseudomonadota bacterium]